MSPHPHAHPIPSLTAFGLRLPRGGPGRGGARLLPFAAGRGSGRTGAAGAALVHGGGCGGRAGRALQHQRAPRASGGPGRGGTTGAGGAGGGPGSWPAGATGGGGAARTRPPSWRHLLAALLEPGKAARGRAGPAGLRARWRKELLTEPRGARRCCRPTGRHHPGTHRLLGAAPAPARPPLPRNGDESPAAVAGPGCSRPGRARGHDGICSPGPRGARRELWPGPAPPLAPGPALRGSPAPQQRPAGSKTVWYTVAATDL